MPSRLRHLSCLPKYANLTYQCNFFVGGGPGAPQHVLVSHSCWELTLLPLLLLPLLCCGSTEQVPKVCIPRQQ